ncbi:hypothetical protein GTY65_12210 [Streptomyces sp. SID8379]|uniref:hypothetical protein n=1 Tax=unclassified Streptomyces TaxID=2593676 RepID=UPI00037317B7|nr:MULTISPECIES: hypothetical protein [unclassified Streptomyces]MYW64823.1 hypothetical protein [Streptomyces sp. SID8379]
MRDGSHQESGLSKSVWSDADFVEMGWHDATVHGLSVQPTDDILPRLLFDLDYIVRWVHPVPPATHFSFWVSPATLVFEDVFDLEGDLDFTGLALDLELDGIHRLVPDDARENFAHVPLWHIDGHAFELKFRASGFRQYVRRAPRLVSRQALSPAERGSCAFTERGFG